MHDAQGGTTSLPKPDPRQLKTTFNVKHYAGVVSYTAVRVLLFYGYTTDILRMYYYYFLTTSSANSSIRPPPDAPLDPSPSLFTSPFTPPFTPLFTPPCTPPCTPT